MEASLHHRRFEVLCGVHRVWNFLLVLCASVWGCVGGHMVRTLEVAVAEEKAKRGFGNFSSDS